MDKKKAKTTNDDQIELEWAVAKCRMAITRLTGSESPELFPVHG
jgi:hypothetical protein